MAEFASPRSWWTLTTFPPRAAIISEMLCNSPGLSISGIVRFATRPDFSRPRVITRLRIVTSMLPPDSTHTTFFPFSGSFPNITAATATAPAPSAISFWCSISSSTALAASSSVTVTISSTYLLMRSNVMSPGHFTAIPSANVETEDVGIF